MKREDVHRKQRERMKQPDENFVGRKNELKEFHKRLSTRRPGMEFLG